MIILVKVVQIRCIPTPLLQKKYQQTVRLQTKFRKYRAVSVFFSLRKL